MSAPAPEGFAGDIMTRVPNLAREQGGRNAVGCGGHCVLAERHPFTVVEVMMASLIAAVLLVGVMGAMIGSFHLMKTTRYQEEASALAADQLWIVFNLPYDDLLTYASPTTVAVPATSDLFAMGGTVRTSVQVNSNNCAITVRVDWNQRRRGSGVTARSVTQQVQRYRNER